MDPRFLERNKADIFTTPELAARLGISVGPAFQMAVQSGPIDQTPTTKPSRDQEELAKRSGYIVIDRDIHYVPGGIDDPDSEEYKQKQEDKRRARAALYSQSLQLGNGITLTFENVLSHLGIIEAKSEDKKAENIKEAVETPKSLAIGADGKPIKTRAELQEWYKTQPKGTNPDYFISQEDARFVGLKVVDGRKLYAAHLANQDLQQTHNRANVVQQDLQTGKITLDDIAKDPQLKEMLQQSAEGNLVLNDLKDYNAEGVAMPKTLAEIAIEQSGKIYTPSLPNMSADTSFLQPSTRDDSAPDSILRLKQPTPLPFSAGPSL
jgi:hypothetical protein